MASSDPPTISPNLFIDPKYLEWKKTLGAGGCGVVHLVNHGTWGPIAIKKLSTGFMTEYVMNVQDVSYQIG